MENVFETHIEIKKNNNGEYVEQTNVPFSIGFINPFVVINSSNKKVKSFIEEHVGEKYRIWVTELAEMPDFFSRDIVDDAMNNTTVDFFNGFSIAQYLQSRSEGGVNINPVFQGAYNNPEAWKVFLSRRMNAETVFYIDAPYELYLETTKAHNPVPRDQYEKISKAQKQFVDSLHQMNKQEIH